VEQACLKASFALTVFILSILPIFGDPIVLTDSTLESPVGFYAEYLEDTSGRLTIQDITSEKTHWQKSEQESLSFGFSKSAYWIKFKAKNDSMKSDWVIDADNPILQGITLYKPDGLGKYLEKRTGSLLPFSSREFVHTDFVFAL